MEILDFIQACSGVLSPEVKMILLVLVLDFIRRKGVREEAPLRQQDKAQQEAEGNDGFYQKRYYEEVEQNRLLVDIIGKLKAEKAESERLCAFFQELYEAQKKELETLRAERAIFINGSGNNLNLNNTEHTMEIGTFNGKDCNIVEGTQYLAAEGATQYNNCTISGGRPSLTANDSKVKTAIQTMQGEKDWAKQKYWAVWKVLMACGQVNTSSQAFAEYLIRIGVTKDNVYDNIRKLDAEYREIAHVRPTEWEKYKDRCGDNYNRMIDTASRFIELLDS